MAQDKPKKESRNLSQESPAMLEMTAWAMCVFPWKEGCATSAHKTLDDTDL